MNTEKKSRLVSVHKKFMNMLILNKQPRTRFVRVRLQPYNEHTLNLNGQDLTKIEILMVKYWRCC